MTGSVIDRFQDKLNDAIFDIEILPSALSVLSEITNARATQLIVAYESAVIASSYFSEGFDPNTIEMEKDYWAINPRATAAPDMEIGRVYRDADLLSEEERLQHKAYVDFFIPAGVSHFAGIVLFREADHFVGLACLRDEGSGAFTEAETEAFRLASELSRNIFTLARNLAARKADYALELLSPAAAAAVVGPTGQVSKSNGAFTDLMNAGHCKSAIDGTVEFGFATTIEIMDFFKSGSDQSVQKLPIKSLKSDQFYTIQALPLPQVGFGHTESDHAVLVLEQVEQQPSLDVELAKRVFNLTQSESEVAAALYSGLVPQRIAEQRGVAPSTIKTLLKGVMTKTETSRQIETIARLNSLPRK